MGADRQLTVTRPMPTDKPTTASEMLWMLIVKCDSSAELAATSLDRSIFSELAKEARAIHRALTAERIAALYGRRSNR